MAASDFTGRQIGKTKPIARLWRKALSAKRTARPVVPDLPATSYSSAKYTGRQKKSTLRLTCWPQGVSYILLLFVRQGRIVYGPAQKRIYPDRVVGGYRNHCAAHGDTDAGFAKG